MDILDPPPPYEAHCVSYEADFAAWPSSYYGRTRRIDIAKFYQDVLNESSKIQYESSYNSSSSSSSDEEDRPVTKKVTFCPNPPRVYEYEPEFDAMPSKYKSRLLDEGWPGRAKLAESSDGFMDFKSKIEARLSAVNDPSLVSQLQTDSNFRQSTDSSRWLKTLSSIKRNSILSKSK